MDPRKDQLEMGHRQILSDPKTKAWVDEQNKINIEKTLGYDKSYDVLVQGGVPPPASNTTYLLPAYENLQKLLSELSSVQTSSLGMMAHLQF